MRISVGSYVLTWTLQEQSWGREQRAAAAAVETIGRPERENNTGVLTVSLGSATPPLLVVIAHDQRWYDGHEINVGVLLVPETDVLFVGAADEVVAYNLRSVRRLWRAEAESGFWGLARHGDTIVMQAELALVAWDLHGMRLWETFVEPPYDVTMHDDTVHLTVMGTVMTFPLATGPAWGGRLPWSAS